MEHATIPPLRGPSARHLVADALRQLIAEKGEAEATKFMGLSRPTIGRLVGAMSVQPATFVVAAQRLGIDLRGVVEETDGEGTRG
jgi:hypothetical protein